MTLKTIKELRTGYRNNPGSGLCIYIFNGSRITQHFINRVKNPVEPM